jgi:hypothetical protein
VFDGKRGTAATISRSTRSGGGRAGSVHLDSFVARVGGGPLTLARETDETGASGPLGCEADTFTFTLSLAFRTADAALAEESAALPVAAGDGAMGAELMF